MSELLKRRRRLTEVETRYYSYQLIKSLLYLHHHGVIHRDLKLGNLFINKAMNIKVGDFGLAAQLVSHGERKRTICGTPNYIAPEILQGKKGHSYEVDIWSLGVIIFTMMVGKPPYESKDVKATYRRILSNSYTFPSHITMSDDLKSLIQSLLQLQPDARLSLQQVISHPFFTNCPSGQEEDLFLPPRLPTMSLYHTPTDDDIRESAREWREQNPNHEEEKEERKENRRHGGLMQVEEEGDEEDVEDDPYQVNKQNLINHQRGGRRSRFPQMDQENVNPNTNQNRNRNSRRENGALRVLKPSNGSSNAMVAVASKYQTRSTTRRNGEKEDNSTNHHQDSMSNHPNMPRYATRSSTAASRKEREQNRLRKNQRPTNPPPSVRSSNNGRSSSSSQKFSSTNSLKDEELDNQNSNDITPSITPDAPPRKKKAWEGGRNRRVPFDIYCEKNEQNQNDDNSKEEKSGENSGEVVDVWKEKRDRAQSAPPTSGSRGRGDRMRVEGETPNSKNFSPTSEEEEEEEEDVAVMMDNHLNLGKKKKLNGMLEERDAHSNYKTWNSQSSNQPTTPSPTQNNQNQFSTPLDQKIDTNTIIQRDVGTLENLHKTIKSANLQSTASSHMNRRGGMILEDIEEEDESVQMPKTWVINYVDYTTKYGLGFLNSDGTLGVYFNDSTKIITYIKSFSYPEGNEEEEGAKPEITLGSRFWYIERKRSEDGVRLPEHKIAQHLMDDYPSELRKKVTLMSHFSSHLFVQGMEDKMDLTGVRGSSTIEHVHVPVYVKKWVKTSHAILLRLSNSTVQVIFTDNSEIQLSSEAQHLNFIDKRGEKSCLALAEITQANRPDVSKRLKFTKDMLKSMIEGTIGGRNHEYTTSTKSKSSHTQHQTGSDGRRRKRGGTIA